MNLLTSKKISNNSVYKSLKEYCRNATNREGDTFVGIKSEMKDGKHEISINFPIGYNISNSDEKVRNEILDLIEVLATYKDKKSQLLQTKDDYFLNTVRFPVHAYFRVMQYFLQHDYYMENEEIYGTGISGPINMKQTIKKISPIVQKSGFVYPSLIVRKNNDTDKYIITEINKFCVYESFMKFGWIYKQRLPKPPSVRKPNLKAYQAILKQKLELINNDKLKQLFQNMLSIIEYKNSVHEQDEFYFGTNNFEYVWEKLIDEIFGQPNKNYYFPKTKWNLTLGERKNAALEPDTIMLTEDCIVVLDAKYYRYGVSSDIKDLPRSTSINKQITYAEYIAKNSKFKINHENNIKVLNAFLLPFNREENEFGSNCNYFSIGEAVADWKHSDKDYERVQGIVVDVKKLMSISSKPNKQEIRNLSDAIKKSLLKYKKT